jgi:hypothetical protein
MARQRCKEGVTERRRRNLREQRAQRAISLGRFARAGADICGLRDRQMTQLVNDRALLPGDQQRDEA